MQWKEEQVGIDVLGEADLDTVDLLRALPRDVAGPAIRWAVERDVWVVDLSGSAWHDELGPLCVPWLQADRVPEDARVLCVPCAEATIVASILEPLRRAGIHGSAHANVLVPASTQGRAAVEELSQQVVALFNTTPQRRSFLRASLSTWIPRSRQWAMVDGRNERRRSSSKFEDFVRRPTWG